jgi:hypothetical protein
MNKDPGNRFFFLFKYVIISDGKTHTKKKNMTFRVIFLVYLLFAIAGHDARKRDWLSFLFLINLTFDSSISKKISTTTKWPPRPLSSKREIDNQKSEFLKIYIKNTYKLLMVGVIYRSFWLDYPQTNKLQLHGQISCYYKYNL